MSSSQLESPAPRATSLARASFHSLPIETRKNIYKRVLAVPHPLYLFQDPGCQVETFAPGKPYRWLALLYTNRQISDEARAVLYGANQFVLQEATKRQGGLLKSFLNCIGPVNSGFLSHLCIRFPATERVEESQSGEIRLRDDGLQTLQLLQNQCTNLGILEILIYDENSSGLIEEDRMKDKFVQEVFLQIDAQLRSIASLDIIVVRVYCRALALQSIEDVRGRSGGVYRVSQNGRILFLALIG